MSMMQMVFNLLGQTTQSTGGSPVSSFLTSGAFPLLLMAVVFYFLLIRPRQRQDRSRKDMLSSLKRGDRVQTIGGILGSVVEVNDSDVLLKVDETSNTKIRFSRSAIHRVVEEEKGQSK